MLLGDIHSSHLNKGYIVYFSAASILARANSYVLSVFIGHVLISNYQPKLKMKFKKSIGLFKNLT